jgi:general secretion pathway protein M
MKETAYSWWRQLAPRERRLISWGGTGLLAAVLYAYLWLPITVERHKLRANLPQLRANAAQMQRQAQEAAQLKASATPALRGEAIKSAIHQAANEAGLDSKTLQVNLLDEGRANIAWATVPFDAWTMLVANLQKNQGIRLESCTIEALPETGLVSVRAVVTAAA